MLPIRAHDAMPYTCASLSRGEARRGVARLDRRRPSAAPVFRTTRPPLSAIGSVRRWVILRLVRAGVFVLRGFVGCCSRKPTAARETRTIASGDSSQPVPLVGGIDPRTFTFPTNRKGLRGVRSSQRRPCRNDPISRNPDTTHCQDRLPTTISYTTETKTSNMSVGPFGATRETASRCSLLPMGREFP